VASEMTLRLASGGIPPSDAAIVAGGVDHEVVCECFPHCKRLWMAFLEPGQTDQVQELLGVFSEMEEE
jgi:hypothetical protein